MKKLIFVLVALSIIFSLTSKPQEITSFTGYVWLNSVRDLMKIDVKLLADIDNEEIYLLIDIPTAPIEIIIDQEYRDLLAEYINDFQRKVRIADMREETYDTELGKFETARSRFYKFKKWHDSKFNSTANFFSQKKERHQFLLMLSPMNSQPGGNIKREGVTVYFEQKETKKLEKYFSKKKFESYLK